VAEFLARGERMRGQLQGSREKTTRAQQEEATATAATRAAATQETTAP